MVLWRGAAQIVLPVAEPPGFPLQENRRTEVVACKAQHGLCPIATVEIGGVSCGFVPRLKVGLIRCSVGSET